ncbi:hypothetical protein SETIT_9G271200v2 [Setaria italica]|uniref:Uncharacterized protein n=1 Tax=Setaria italica TaxID=4555 RepID=A0A368SL36_SETIT|nr:hypothetical protein SETIT_9G271200v2 [Setaria italica]
MKSLMALLCNSIYVCVGELMCEKEGAHVQDKDGRYTVNKLLRSLEALLPNTLSPAPNLHLPHRQFGIHCLTFNSDGVLHHHLFCYYRRFVSQAGGDDGPITAGFFHRHRRFMPQAGGDDALITTGVLHRPVVMSPFHRRFEQAVMSFFREKKS